MVVVVLQSRAGECANNNVVKLKPRDIQFLFDLYPGLRELHRKKVPEGNRHTSHTYRQGLGLMRMCRGWEAPCVMRLTSSWATCRWFPCASEISEGKFWEQTLRSIRFHRQRASLSQDEYFQAQALPTVNAKDNKEVGRKQAVRPLRLRHTRLLTIKQTVVLASAADEVVCAELSLAGRAVAGAGPSSRGPGVRPDGGRAGPAGQEAGHGQRQGWHRQ